MNHSSFGFNNLGMRGPECGLYVDLLPLIDTDFLSVDERAAVRRHLEACAACRGRLAAFAPVDAALQRYVDWLEEEAPHPSAWQPENNLLHVADDYTGPTLFPADPLPNHAPSHRLNSAIRPTRFVSVLSAIAAVLLIALSAMVFVLFGYGRISHPGPVTEQATCTPDQITAHLPKDARLNDLAMISPDEGWLVGSTYGPPTSGPVISQSLILHYSHCRWTQEPITLPGVALGHISVVSASNVWVLGYKESFQQDSTGETEVLTSLALHYTGGQWQVRPFPITIGPDRAVTDFTMISSTEGWMLVEHNSGLTLGTPYQLYHGLNGVWSLVSMPGYQNLWPVKPFAPGAAWLIGEDSSTGQPHLLLYRNDTLTPMYTLPPNALLYANADIQIEMDSPQSAWVSEPILSTRGAQTGWLLLHCGLSSCRQSSLGNDPRIQTSDTVQVFSANAGWAFLRKNQQGAYTGHINDALRLHNGEWQSVPWPFQVGAVSVIIQSSPNEYWALVDHATILHFVNGAWSSYS